MDPDTNPYEAPRARVDSPADVLADIERVASAQKLVIIAIAVNLVMALMKLATGVLVYPAALLALAYTIYSILRLADALVMQLAAKVLLSLLMLVPLANLIAMLVMHARATRTLRSAGREVGRFGVLR
jgi:hypothetical protein